MDKDKDTGKTTPEKPTTPDRPGGPPVRPQGDVDSPGKNPPPPPPPANP